jgi:hypothetical protein
LTLDKNCVTLCSMNEIQRYESDALTEMQKNVVPLVAMNVPATKIAQMYKIPAATISAWTNTDVLFKSAVEDVRSNTDAVIKAFINQAGVLAAQYAIEKITEPIDNSDVVGRRIQADMAKSVLGMISSRKTDVKLMVEQPAQAESNINAESAAIVREYSSAPSNRQSYVVINDVKILEDEPLMHVDTSYGEMNIDEENGTLQCHVCGKYVKDFVLHIRSEHSISPMRYREIYKIPEEVSFFVGE